MNVPSDAASGADQSRPPVLQIVSGDPAPEHVAALVAVFSAMGSGEEPDEAQVSAWSRSARASRRFPRPSPDAWRLSQRR